MEQHRGGQASELKDSPGLLEIREEGAGFQKIRREDPERGKMS